MAIPLTNPPVMFRNKQLATHFFGSDAPGQYMRSIPRQKFMYYVNFVVNPTVLTIYPDLRGLSYWETGISFMVKSIGRPRIDLATTKLNEYNRHKNIYTKVNYGAFSMNILDTVDDRLHNLWLKYFKYYFGDSRPKSAYALKDTLVDQSYYDGSGWGLRPINEAKNFFQKIELYAIFGGRYTQIDYINPRITSIDWHNFDASSNGSDGQDADLSLEYEFLDYVQTGAIITSELVDQFGFDVDVHVEPIGVPPPAFAQLASDAYSLLSNIAFGTASPLLNSVSQNLLGGFGFNSSLASGIIGNASATGLSSIFNQVNGVIPTNITGGMQAAVSGLFSDAQSLTTSNALSSLGGTLNFGTSIINNNNIFGAPANSSLSQIVPNQINDDVLSTPLSLQVSDDPTNNAAEITAAAASITTTDNSNTYTETSIPDYGAY